MSTFVGKRSFQILRLYFCYTHGAFLEDSRNTNATGEPSGLPGNEVIIATLVYSRM